MTAPSTPAAAPLTLEPRRALYYDVGATAGAAQDAEIRLLEQLDLLYRTT